VLIAKDVTEKKANELRQIMTERLAALGQIASGLSHEINNPLATISVSVERLLKGVQEGRFDPQLFGDYLSIVREEGQRIRGITSSMLSFATKKGSEKKEVNIHKLLDNTVETVSLQGRFKEIEVLRNYREDLPCILTREGELRQVFLTIINNALDAMGERGRLTLETGTEDNSVFIKISDIGPGIPPGTRERIFTPFFTTKAERGGSGLGLSIAHKIIEENKGKIKFTSEEGKGTTFKITLPLIVSVSSLSNLPASEHPCILKSPGHPAGSEKAGWESPIDQPV
jgi:two-component system NtrC family sensor kinase